MSTSAQRSWPWWAAAGHQPPLSPCSVATEQPLTAPQGGSRCAESSAYVASVHSSVGFRHRRNGNACLSCQPVLCVRSPRSGLGPVPCLLPGCPFPDWWIPATQVSKQRPGERSRLVRKQPRAHWCQSARFGGQKAAGAVMPLGFVWAEALAGQSWGPEAWARWSWV